MRKCFRMALCRVMHCNKSFGLAPSINSFEPTHLQHLLRQFASWFSGIVIALCARVLTTGLICGKINACSDKFSNNSWCDFLLLYLPRCVNAAGVYVNHLAPAFLTFIVIEQLLTNDKRRITRGGRRSVAIVAPMGHLNSSSVKNKLYWTVMSEFDDRDKMRRSCLTWKRFMLLHC